MALYRRTRNPLKRNNLLTILFFLGILQLLPILLFNLHQYVPVDITDTSPSRATIQIDILNIDCTIFFRVLIDNSPTQPIDDTFSSNLENLTFPMNIPEQKHDLYQPNATMGLLYKIQEGRGKESRGDIEPLRCDIKCNFIPRQSVRMRQYVYGTNWEFVSSLEGSHSYSSLKIGDSDWKNNKFFMTTSFQSEIPSTYFSLYKKFNWWGNTLQTPPVNFTEAIKGASFLARNCGAKNNRNEVVKQLIHAGLRVDSLSSCLHNADPPPGVNLENKTNVMEKYLFHLAFENGRTDDYITEKLWGSFHSGTLPVVLGPDNIKEHIGSLNGAIYVDDFPTVEDLAKFLIELSNNETLYYSYHVWRKESYPEQFVAKYNFTRVHPRCRLCRWAFAKKVGLGWDHKKQTMEAVSLRRDTCIQYNEMKSPVVESWWDGSGLTQRRLKLSPSGTYQAASCPIANGTIVTSRVGNNNLIRSLWSNDGTTDMYIEGRLSTPVLLNLQLPFTFNSIQADDYTVWFQNEHSRITLVLNSEGSNAFDSASVITASHDVVEVNIDPNNLPMRIRIILEDQDTHHKGAADERTYYGQIMADDVFNAPELFVLQ